MAIAVLTSGETGANSLTDINANFAQLALNITGASIQSTTDAATITPVLTTDNYVYVEITAIGQAFTIANPSGTPYNFQRMLIRIKDNATARAITWGNGYVAAGVALPSTTVLSKIMTLGFIYNTANSLNKWQLVGLAQEA